MARILNEEEKQKRTRAWRKMNDAGLPTREIAARLGINACTLREWLVSQGLRAATRNPDRDARLPRPDVEAARNAPKMERSCLTCGKAFISTRAEGAWLRMCEYCRARPLSPYTPGGAGHSGRRVGSPKGPA